MNRYDIIIAGGGVAGLSLVFHLLNSPLRNRSILIIDRELKVRNDVTLSYWTTGRTFFDDAAIRAWKRIQIVSEDHDQIYDLRRYTYKTIRGIDFYRFAQDYLGTFPNVESMIGDIEGIEDGDDGAVVIVDGKRYTANWVFDSLFNMTEFKPDKRRYGYLQQHFKGLEIAAPEPRFDPDVITMFDFRTPQKGELRFYYTLPYSDSYALVEYVALSRERYEHDLREHIETVMGIKAYVTLNEEGGVSPLTDYPFPRRKGKRVMSIGIQGGMIKASSGYAFTRIQEDSAAIVRSLLRHEHPFDVQYDPWFFRFCDAMVLKMMAYRGEWMKPFFLTMFKRNPMDRIFKFLDNGTSPWENFLIMASLCPRLISSVLGSLRLSDEARLMRSAVQRQEQ